MNSEKLMLLLLLLLLPVLFLVSPGYGAEQEEASNPDKTKAETGLNEPTRQAAEANNETSLQKQSPDENKLRERKLSDAFKKFVPSESISADNAVPFPVDI